MVNGLRAGARIRQTDLNGDCPCAPSPIADDIVGFHDVSSLQTSIRRGIRDGTLTSPSMRPGRAQLAAERALTEKAIDNGWRWRVLRTSNAYNFRDPGAPPPAQRFPPLPLREKVVFLPSPKSRLEPRTKIFSLQ